MGILTNLVFLDLDFNVLTGSIPTALYLLTNLQTLDLNDNLLEGDIDSIGVLGDLEFLQLQSKECIVSWFYPSTNDGCPFDMSDSHRFLFFFFYS